MLSSGKLHLYEENELPTLLSKKNKEYIQQLPEQIIKDCGDHSILFTHYALPDRTGSSTWSPKKSKELASHFNFMGHSECLYSFSGNDHLEGMEIFTANIKLNTNFETVALSSEKTWVHGPAVARGTTHNGFMIYNSSIKELSAVPLNSKRHMVPTHI